jgi:hypothetical protein
VAALPFLPELLEGEILAGVAEAGVTAERAVESVETVTETMTTLAELKQAYEEGRHVMRVTLVGREGQILRDYWEVSGDLPGFLGHTEPQSIIKLYPELEPGQTLILQGQSPVCSYGVCQEFLSGTARDTGIDILYYADHGKYTTTRTYYGGEGFVPKSLQIKPRK